jgi:hypothetical protein
MRRHAHANLIVWGADIDLIRANVRFWPIADILVAPHMSAFGGKADIDCSTNIR